MATKRNRNVPVRPTTIADVAEAAGVSRATVSRVANGLPTVNAEIAERVRRAIDELGYSPSGTARSLSLGVSRTVGVMVPDLANPMFQQILQGFHRAAAADGYHVLVTDAQEQSDVEAGLVRDARNRTDAVALCAPRMESHELERLLAQVRPAVVVNRDAASSAVAVDYAAGIRLLAEHLIALGHARIAFLAGPAASRSNSARERGLDDVARAHPGVEFVRIACGSRIADGYAAWDAVQEAGVTAVIAFNDVVALGLLGRLDEEGVPVPGRLSVAGFDDIEFSRFASPTLTTMRVPQAELGEAAWAALRGQIAGDDEQPTTIFQPELVVRASTGVAP